MLAHLSLFQKVWDRGVDIAVSVIATTISAGIAAGVATVTWRWNRKRDLKFEEAKLELKDRRESEQAKREEQSRLQKLNREREGLAEVAAATQIRGMQGDMIDRYIAWLKQNGLDHIPANAKIISKWSSVPGDLRQSPTIPDNNSQKRAAELASDIRSTQLSP
jgi:hypothetical protein